MSKGKKTLSKRNFIAKALRFLAQQVVKARRGRGSYTRQPKHKGNVDE